MDLPIDFAKHQSLCKPQQKHIVSTDQGSSCQHIAHNFDQCHVRHYRVDGDLITIGKRCDFMLLNEDRKHVYLIELKGSNLHQAIAQVEATEKILRKNFPAYAFFYRLIYRAKVHTVQDEKIRRWIARCGIVKKQDTVCYVAVVRHLRYEEPI